MKFPIIEAKKQQLYALKVYAVPFYIECKYPVMLQYSQRINEYRYKPRFKFMVMVSTTYDHYS